MAEAKKDDSVLPANIARECVLTWNIIYQRAESASRQFLHPEFRSTYDPEGFISKVYSDGIHEGFDVLLSYAAGPQSFRDYLPSEARRAGLLVPMVPYEDFPADEDLGLGINLEQNDLGVFGEEDAKRLLLRHIIFMQPIRIEMMQSVLSKGRPLVVSGGSMTFEYDPDAMANDLNSISKAIEIKKERLRKFILDFKEYYGEPFYLPDNLVSLASLEQIPGLTAHFRDKMSNLLPDLAGYIP